MEPKRSYQRTSRTFLAQKRSIELIRALKPVLDTIKQEDRKLEDQIRRAAQSVALNIAEGRGRAGRDQLQHWRIAFGSAREVEAGLDIAVALGLIAEYRIPRSSLDRTIGLLWRMTRS